MTRPLLKPKDDPTQVQFYEGLVRKTASRYQGVIQEEYEDLCSILRIKCWRALESFDASKSRVPIQNYVFSCVRNQVKDLLKRKKRNDLYIEDIAPARSHDQAVRDSFDARYQVTEEEEVFAEVLAETPLIPSTLTTLERQVIVLLYLEYGQADISAHLSVTRREIATAVKGIKDKMADWHPSFDPATEPDEGGHVESEDSVPGAR